MVTKPLTIAALNLPTRAHRALCLAGIDTIEKLTARTFLELWGIKGLGPHTLGKIKTALASRGLALRIDPDEQK